MKKIFACDQFASDENNEYSLSDVTPEEYLVKMLSCIDGGELYIAKEEDDVSISLAENLSVADFVVKYTFAPSKIDADAIIIKEQMLFSACREIAGKKEGKRECKNREKIGWHSKTMNKNREEIQKNGNQKKIDPARRIFCGVAFDVGALPVRAKCAGSVGVNVFHAKVPDKW